MRAASEIRTSIGVLVVLQLLATLGSMGLLLRMVPLFDEETSLDTSALQAREATLGALALASCPDAPVAVGYNDAVTTLEGAVQGPDGQAVVDRLAPEWRPAWLGDCHAREAVVRGLADLARDDRVELSRGPLEARRIATAGSWAAVLLTLINVALSVVVAVRLTRQIASPVEELDQALGAAMRGDTYRRVRRLPAALEFGGIVARINHLLDRRLADAEGADPALGEIDRKLLMHLLDAMPEPTVAVDGSGAILVASQRALDAIASHGGSLSEALSMSVREDGEEVSMVAQVVPFGGGVGFLVTLRERAPTVTAPPPSVIDELPEPSASSAGPGPMTTETPAPAQPRNTTLPDEWR